MDGVAEGHEKAPSHDLWCWPVHAYFSGRDGSKFGARRDMVGFPRRASVPSGHVVAAPLMKTIISRCFISPLLIRLPTLYAQRMELAASQRGSLARSPLDPTDSARQLIPDCMSLPQMRRLTS